MKKNKESGLAVRRAGVFMGYRASVAMSMAFGALFLVASIIIMIMASMLSKANARTPWVAVKTSDGNMVTERLTEYEVTPESVEDFLYFIVSKMTYYRNGRLVHKEDLGPYVSASVLKEYEKTSAGFAQVLADHNYTIQGAGEGLIYGPASAPSFHISRTRGRVYASYAGTKVVVSDVNNNSQRVRWDVMLRIVQPTPENVWGLVLESFHTMRADADPMVIPASELAR